MFQPPTDDDFSYVISYAGEENLVIGTHYGHGDTSSELNAISRFKVIESLNPQVKRKILSDNPRRFYGIWSIIVCPRDIIFSGELIDKGASQTITKIALRLAI